MRAQSLPLALALAACTPSADEGDDVVDTDTDDREETDTTSVDTDETAATDDTDDTDAPVDRGAEVYRAGFEEPALTAGDWTASGPAGWVRENSAGGSDAASAGLVHPTHGMTASSPFAAPGAGNQALYLNAKGGYWARATREAVEMTAGTTYTLVAAVALRSDVAVPENMSVSFYNATDAGSPVPEIQLRTLLDDTVKGAFQQITTTYTATADDEGDLLAVRFATYHTDAALSQLLIDEVAVYASAD